MRGKPEAGLHRAKQRLQEAGLHRAKQRLPGRARDHPVMEIVPNKSLSLSLSLSPSLSQGMVLGLKSGFESSGLDTRQAAASAGPVRGEAGLQDESLGPSHLGRSHCVDSDLGLTRS